MHPDFITIAIFLFGLGMNILAFSALEHGIGWPQLRFPAILTRNLAASFVVVVVYFLFGFDLMYPDNDWGLWWPEPDWNLTFDCAIQCEFALNSAILIFATLSLRMKTPVIMICAGLYTLVTYSVFGRFHWGGGFLSDWAFQDYAGGIGIYALGGSAAAGLGLAFRIPPA